MAELPNYRAQPTLNCCANCVHSKREDYYDGYDWRCHLPGLDPLPVWGFTSREVEPTGICDSFEAFVPSNQAEATNATP